MNNLILSNLIESYCVLVFLTAVFAHCLLFYCFYCTENQEKILIHENVFGNKT